MSLSEEYKQYVIERALAIQHKEGVNSSDWHNVNSKLLILIDYLITHCEVHSLPLTITSIIRPMIKGVSKSKTHQEGRAFDISVRGWKLDDIVMIIDSVNEKHTIGAISLKDGQEREVIYEDGITAGKGAHLHFQCRP